MKDGNAQMAAMQVQFEETIAKLREDLAARLPVQEAANKTMREEREEAAEKEATRADLERMQRGKEATDAENREYEAKLNRLRRERSLGTSFGGQGGGGSADRRGTAATTMGSMWTREVSAGGGLGQGLPYVPRGIVPKFPVKCLPYVYIAWERRFEVFITNQGLGLFGVLDPRCLTGSALLDCHVLKGFGIYMIGILGSLSDVWEASSGLSRMLFTR